MSKVAAIISARPARCKSVSSQTVGVAVALPVTPVVLMSRLY